LIFGKRNSRKAEILYKQRYPDRNHSSEKTFKNIEQYCGKMENFLMENV